MKFLRKIINRLIFPHTYSSEAYIKYLKGLGMNIGEGSRFIAPKECHIDEGRADYISIGKNCCLSYVTILAHDYSWFVLVRAENEILYDRGGRVSIGDNCFIGYQACILKDTIIGNNVIIGARSLVKGTIPSNTVWAGVPAKQICTLEEYKAKRAQTTIEDAKYRYSHIMTLYNRCPTIEEMGFFSFLFLQRTEENYKKYIEQLEFNGRKGDDNIKFLFFNSKPQYFDYNSFCEEIK